MPTRQDELIHLTNLHTALSRVRSASTKHHLEDAIQDVLTWERFAPDEHWKMVWGVAVEAIFDAQDGEFVAVDVFAEVGEVCPLLAQWEKHGALVTDY